MRYLRLRTSLPLTFPLPEEKSIDNKNAVSVRWEESVETTCGGQAHTTTRKMVELRVVRREEVRPAPEPPRRATNQPANSRKSSLYQILKYELYYNPPMQSR